MNPVFVEIGQPENCTMARIKFDLQLDNRLRALKQRADGGEFSIVPASDSARQIKQISLISLAVNLMRLAIFQRGHTIERPPSISRETGGKLRREKKPAVSAE